MKMKYVVIESHGFKLPILGSVLFNHDELICGFSKDKVVNAGFVSFQRDGSGNISSCSCYGNSFLLDKKQYFNPDMDLTEARNDLINGVPNRMNQLRAYWDTL